MARQGRYYGRRFENAVNITVECLDCGWETTVEIVVPKNEPSPVAGGKEEGQCKMCKGWRKFVIQEVH